MDFHDLAKLASGHIEARAIQVAVSLGIFDALEDKPLDGATVAAGIGADPRATELLLNALAALALLEKRGKFFTLNDTSSRYLVRSSSQYLGEMILFDASLWDSWGKLANGVRSGKPVHAADMYQTDPKETERFIYAMHSLVQARGDAEIVAERLDLGNVTDLLDVGSGPGTYTIYFLSKHPKLRATIFDLPGTMKVTEKFVRTSRVADRIRLVTGDYRVDPIAGTYQMIFLSNIIHAESGDQNALLFAKLYGCLDHGGKIVVKDHILDESLTHPAVGAVFSLLMLLTTVQG
ncbi:MAG: methyltransferase, partial [Candidatus Binatia bacterium]